MTKIIICAIIEVWGYFSHIKKEVDFLKILGHEVKGNYEFNIFLFSLQESLGINLEARSEGELVIMGPPMVERQFVEFLELPFVNNQMLEKTLDYVWKRQAKKRRKDFFEEIPKLFLIAILISLFLSLLANGTADLKTPMGMVDVALLVIAMGLTAYVAPKAWGEVCTEPFDYDGVLSLMETLLTARLAEDPSIDALIEKYGRKSNVEEPFVVISGDFVGDVLKHEALHDALTIAADIFARAKGGAADLLIRGYFKLGELLHVDGDVIDDSGDDPGENPDNFEE